MDDMLRMCLRWINEYISLYRRDMELLRMHHLYGFVSVLLLSHCTGFSMAKTIDILRAEGVDPPHIAIVRFICGNILAFSPTGRGLDGGGTWLAQRDQTPLLTQLEKKAFRQTCKVFVSPNYTLATLDDDLYGTRASDNQVKSLSNRKADREGHQADAIADSLFRVTLMVRFRRRGESVFSNVRNLVDALLEGRAEQSIRGFVLTADRGYGKVALLRELLKHGIGSIMIMPDHLLQCHPFVGQSYLNVMRHDYEELDGDETDGSTDSDQALQQEDDPSTSDIVPGPTTLSTDRARTFILNDEPSQGPKTWFAGKTLEIRNRGESHAVNRVKVTAVAVRERGTDKFSRIIRFIYSLPSSFSTLLESWIAVPKCTRMIGTLFSKRDNTGRLTIPPNDSTEFQDVIERHILDHCSVLTLDQRCADWFVLRQFRVTGTSAGKILHANDAFREMVGLSEPTCTEQTLQQSLLSFVQTWFGGGRSTEPMMRVEIKTNVAQSSLDRALGLATADLVTCEVGDQSFRRYIPAEHIGQILHQMLVLAVKYVIYVSCSESGIMYTVLVHCNNSVLDTCLSALNAIALPVVSWAHQPGPLQIPSFSDTETTKVLQSRFQFWSLVNNYVTQNDAFPPLKLFKHASQSLYSRTKGGVDGSTRARAILRSSTSAMKWEQKVVTQTLKTLSVNAFISWRMSQKRDLLQSKETFRSLKSYRQALNGIQSLADFVHDASKELIFYAQSLGTEDNAETLEVPQDEIQRLHTLARTRKRRHLVFFNGPDGISLRLNVKNHILKKHKGQQYCALCGIRGITENEEGWRGHRTTYKCLQCDVYLCTRIYRGLRKSCSEV
ncbi:hypothetical protein BWQ96_06222 [Gracilariopsis chorda]|uniref:PiggyBac transposable element-derived protein domain-containing protein n=1 Tax=Gracilariopsis chorda TaxID=448386 RepID=A0A2V3IPL2_9FLOR|nr:hypothetical protein BWQ96_06222 [Gracilariopsis chorda]|eukprot:PXF43989.1 hypothetical protein BWQ96_06222 [Gracilariopsis chorda]